MARWSVEFLLSVIELLFLSFTVEALQGKMCQNSLRSGGARSLAAKISGGRGRPCGIFFGFYKTRHILLSDSANCTVLRAVVLTQYWRVTHGRTDGLTDRQTELPLLVQRCNASIAARCKKCLLTVHSTASCITVKSNLAACCCKNLSNRALNTLTL